MPAAAKIKNFEALATTAARRTALEIAEAGLRAIDTAAVIRRFVRLEGQQLCLPNNTCSLAETKRIFVVGVGKCAAAAASALEEILADRLTGGLVFDLRLPDKTPMGKVEYYSGSHPLPTDENVAVTTKLVHRLSGLTAEDLVLVIVSGGGSTLLCLPDAGGACLEERIIVQTLSAAGATIQEMNTVRKHLSLARGGHLAKYAYPAQVIGLIFSDVPGDDIRFVASGPTVKDHTTMADAEKVLLKYRVLNACGLEHGGLLETPKEEKYFAKVTNVTLVSNTLALEAMAAAARVRGLAAEVCSNCLTGEARVTGENLAQALRGAAPHSVQLYGGETTVSFGSLGPAGRGGRNQEVALAALGRLAPSEVVLALASDGRDNGDYAGALADERSLTAAAEKNLSLTDYLTGHDATTFFEQIGGLLETGPTGSNVADLLIALKW